MWRLTRLIFADELVTTVVNNALHADQGDASDTEVAHELFRMHLAKV